MKHSRVAHAFLTRSPFVPIMRDRFNFQAKVRQLCGEHVAQPHIYPLHTNPRALPPLLSCCSPSTLPTLLAFLVRAQLFILPHLLPHPRSTLPTFRAIYPERKSHPQNLELQCPTRSVQSQDHSSQCLCPALCVRFEDAYQLLSDTA